MHSSLFPEADRENLWRQLSVRKISQHLHYQGEEQAARWSALYEKWSPYATRPDFGRMFDEAFHAIAGGASHPVAVVGLGCGGAQKEIALATRLRAAGRSAILVGVDVSVPLLTDAALRARERVPGAGRHWLAAQLSQAEDLQIWLNGELGVEVPRLFTFFSVVPNLNPEVFATLWRTWVRPGDRVLLSVNLLPGPDARAGMEGILPQYDNVETRAWLMAFLEQGGLRAADGELRFTVETDEKLPGSRRMVARWHFSREATLHVRQREFSFQSGEALEVFFSWRHRLEPFQTLLTDAGLAVERSWESDDGEEAVLLCRSAGG
ncbi:MAG TPA: hypothetical protein DCY13_25045 [Verrucomicrobiales bacterium]|nr:hypothetical protein [Verrucomicrobiales bacterium]